MFAKALDAELALPPAFYRSAFDANATWHSAPAASLLDVEAITEHWSNKGVIIHTVMNAASHLSICPLCCHIHYFHWHSKRGDVDLVLQMLK